MHCYLRGRDALAPKAHADVVSGFSSATIGCHHRMEPLRASDWTAHSLIYRAALAYGSSHLLIM